MWLPSPPLVGFIDHWLTQRGLSENQGMPLLGCDARALRRWRHRPYVQDSTVDRIITQAGGELHGIYPPEDYPMLYAA